jgi:hypothetical protein
VLTYAALLFAAGDAPQLVGLVNPRLGTYFEVPVSELSMDVAGLDADELLQQLIFDIASAEISL